MFGQKAARLGAHLVEVFGEVEVHGLPSQARLSAQLNQAGEKSQWKKKAFFFEKKKQKTFAA
jgi:hypothetical protein